jgi:hypothetical protein
MYFRDGPLVVVAIDPGGRTGIAVMRCSYHTTPWNKLELLNREWVRLTMGPEEHHRALYRFLEQHRTHNYVIICESFQDRPNKRVVELSSPEYIGVVKLYAQNEKVPVVFQGPSVVNGKEHFWTDEKLQRADLWKNTSTTHERDATKHLLQWLTFDLQDQYYLKKAK